MFPIRYIMFALFSTLACLEVRAALLYTLDVSSTPPRLMKIDTALCTTASPAQCFVEEVGPLQGLPNEFAAISVDMAFCNDVLYIKSSRVQCVCGCNPGDCPDEGTSNCGNCLPAPVDIIAVNHSTAEIIGAGVLRRDGEVFETRYAEGLACVNGALIFSHSTCLCVGHSKVIGELIPVLGNDFEITVESNVVACSPADNVDLDGMTTDPSGAILNVDIDNSATWIGRVTATCPQSRESGSYAYTRSQICAGSCPAVGCGPGEIEFAEGTLYGISNCVAECACEIEMKIDCSSCSADECGVCRFACPRQLYVLDPDGPYDPQDAVFVLHEFGLPAVPTTRCLAGLGAPIGPIPTTSWWGGVVMVGLLLTAGFVVFKKPRPGCSQTAARD